MSEESKTILQEEELTAVAGGSGKDYAALAAAEKRPYLVMAYGRASSCWSCERGKRPPFQGSLYARVFIPGDSYADARCYECGKFDPGGSLPVDSGPDWVNPDL